MLSEIYLMLCLGVFPKVAQSDQDIYGTLKHLQCSITVLAASIIISTSS